MRKYLILTLLISVPVFAEVIEQRSNTPAAPPRVKRRPVVPQAAPAVPKPALPRGNRTFKNGAGPTGNNWSSGVDNGKPGSTGARRGEFTSEGAGQCGPGQDLWEAAGKVMSAKVIPQNKNYDLMAPGWARIAGFGTSLSCEFGSGKVSMCTSATAAAICQHFADLAGTGSLTLTPQQIKFLNGPQVKAAVNGNTYSIAFLIQHLGGASIKGKGSDIFPVLSKAKIGDLLRIDRHNGTGHSTIFQKLEPSSNQFCYWSSNTLTEGTGVQCENISSLSEVVVSRFPADLGALPGKIDKATGPWGMGKLTARRANSMKESEVRWATSLECPAGVSASPTKPE